jgi:hypothetical protein
LVFVEGEWDLSELIGEEETMKKSMWYQRVLVLTPGSAFVHNSGATMNDHGQVVFGATLSDGRGVLLVATPHRK